MKQVRRSGVERREQITRAALAILDEEGSGALSVATVAHRVGLAPSALYRHFPDKDAMIEDMLARLGTAIRANLERAAAESREDALAALGGFISRHVAFILENRGFPMLIFSDLVLQHPGRRATMRANFENLLHAIAGLLREGQRQGSVRADLDPPAAAYACFGLFMPPGLYWHLSGGRLDLAGVVRHNWTVFLAGIRTPEPPATRARASRRAPRKESRS